MNKKAIACIGQGFVGGSLSTGMSHAFNVLTFDLAGKVAPGALRGGESIEDLVRNAEKTESFTGVYFVCLPTPMYEDGEADLRIVEGALQQLADVPGKRIAVVKSTVPPGSTEIWNKMFADTGLTVVFNPEFLTEAHALEDFKNQNRIVVGGPRPHTGQVKEVFQAAFPKVPIIKTSSTCAEMVKYVTNCFLATKVSFANEMAQICEMLNDSGLDIDYDKVIEYARYDKRLGDSHWSVPGPVATHDGRYVRGFGGHCVVEGTKVSYVPKWGEIKYGDFHWSGEANEPMKVEDIKPGQEVVSTDDTITNVEHKLVDSVKARMYSGDVFVFETKTSKVTVTPEHILPVMRDGKLILLQAKDITTLDELYVVDNRNTVKEKIAEITKTHYEGNVYNLELKSTREEDDLFWVCNGIVVHNCFPKDLNALKVVANKCGVDTKVLDGVWAKNLEVRGPEDRDWEHMQNRAVSKRDN